MPERNQADVGEELGCQADIEGCCYRASRLARGRSTYPSGNRHGHLQRCSHVRIGKRTVEAWQQCWGAYPNRTRRTVLRLRGSDPSTWPPVPSGTLYMTIHLEGDGGHGRLTRFDEPIVRTETYATYCGKYGRSTGKFLRTTGRSSSHLDIGTVPLPALPRSEPSATPGASLIDILSDAQQSLKNVIMGDVSFNAREIDVFYQL
jgi:hypothetical protein